MNDLRDRQKELLGMIVETYVETVNPVGSQTVAKRCRNTLSSATIRNEMHELEEQDYITHPHTSAGRVPTDKGYRYYVDHLMPPAGLEPRDIQFIVQEYREGAADIEALIECTSRILATISEQASFIIFPEGFPQAVVPKLLVEGSGNILQHPEFQDWDKSRKLFKALEAKELFLNLARSGMERGGLRVYIGGEHRWRDVWDCSFVMAEYRAGRDCAGVLGILGPRRMAYGRMVPLVDYVAHHFGEMLEPWV